MSDDTVTIEMDVDDLVSAYTGLIIRSKINRYENDPSTAQSQENVAEAMLKTLDHVMKDTHPGFAEDLRDSGERAAQANLGMRRESDRLVEMIPNPQQVAAPNTESR